MTDNKVLDVTSVSFSYGSKAVLRDVSMSLQSGRYYALLGPNGAGKSTLFSLITQLLPFAHGRICVAGVDVTAQPRRALAKMGIVFQQSTLDLDLTVDQNLAYHASLHGMNKTQRAKRIGAELARFHLTEKRHDKVRTLNGGHRRRVEIARALLHEPAILLLDEASVGLDQQSRDAINQHIRQLCRQQNITVLSSTHLIDEVTLDDELIVITQGEIKLQQNCAEALTASGVSNVQDLYKQYNSAVPSLSVNSQ
jgi:ABC-2 type transport system ATP-binding protein